MPSKTQACTIAKFKGGPDRLVGPSAVVRRADWSLQVGGRVAASCQAFMLPLVPGQRAVPFREPGCDSGAPCGPRGRILLQRSDLKPRVADRNVTN